MSAMHPLGTVLVVGGCGFLGHHVVLQLRECDPTVHISVLDLHTDRNRESSVSYYDGDISSKDQVQATLRLVQPQIIVHTASPPAMLHDAALYDRVNIDGTRNLLEGAQEIGTVKAFIYTSSASVVHDNFHDMVDADESLRLVYFPEQREYYTHTKAVAEDLVLTANGHYGMLTTALRPAGIFGEGDLTMVRQVIETARAGKLRFQIGDGTNKFDFTYVGNVAHAHLLAIQALLQTAKGLTRVPIGQRVDGEAFFITNGEPVPFWDFTRAIGAAAGYPMKKKDVWVIPKGWGYVIGIISEWLVWAASFGQRQSTLSRSTIRFACMTRTFRIDKARDRLGYNALVKLDDGIQKGVDWCLSQEKKIQ